MVSYRPVIQNIQLSEDYVTDVLRLDLIHPEISGNKWFKLKKNLEAAQLQNKHTIVTFGGAFSNHIAATAEACKSLGFKSIGIIRGDEKEDLNSTLLKAQENGMLLHFVSRAEYSQKNSQEFKNKLVAVFGNHYLIPEGGNNAEGVFGCMEILNPEWDYDYVFCAAGTATTYAGILASAEPATKLIGINVLKGTNALVDEANQWMESLFPELNKKIGGNEALNVPTINTNFITDNYSFNGYAKLNMELVDFKKQFEEKFSIPLDHVYTAKLFYALTDLIKQKKLKPNSKVLIVHSGGLQGNEGFEKRYRL